MDKRRALGIAGEKWALEYLEGQGWQLLARNYRCRLGELDLVLKDGEQVVFVEVRAKSSDRFGTGFDSITSKKLHKLRLLAQYFLAQQGLINADVRFDVISIASPPGGQATLQHLKGAF